MNPRPRPGPLDDLAARARGALATAGDADLGAVSDRLAALQQEASQRLQATGSPGAGDAGGPLLALIGLLRARQRDVALAARARGDLAAAERAALRYLGFAPPRRPSGDIERPLAADGRYRLVGRDSVGAQLRALTGDASTVPPPCCDAATRRAAADRTGFAALALPGPPAPSASGEAWLLSPLDPGLGFVPCSYGCAAAQQARRASLAGRDLAGLRAVLGVRLLRLAPGIDLVLAGARGRSEGSLRIASVSAVLAPGVPAPIVRLLEALLVRRLLAGPEVRFLDEVIDVKQGLVYVKMLHRSEARWLDLA